MGKHVGRAYAVVVSLLAFGGTLAVLGGRVGAEVPEPPPTGGWVQQAETPAVRIVDLPPATETRSS